MSYTGELSKKHAKSINYSIFKTGLWFNLGGRMRGLRVDASGNDYIISHSITTTSTIGAFASAASGSGVAMSPTGTTGALKVYADDGGAALTPSGSVPDLRCVLGRTLITATQASVNARIFGVQGQVKGYDAVWGNEQIAGCYGYIEIVRSAAAVTLDDYGVTAGCMGTVSTSGTITVGTNHVLAGVAAISKLKSDVTQTGKTAAFYAGIYNTSQWSDGTARSKWKYGLFVDSAAALQGVRVGVGHSTTVGYAIPIDRSTTTAANRFYSDDAGAALSGTGSVPDIRGVLAQTLLTVNQSAGHIRVFAHQALLSAYNAYWNTEVVAATEGRLQIVNTATKTLGNYGISAAVMGTVSTGSASTVVVDTYHYLCGVAAIADLKGTVTQTGKVCAFYVGQYDVTNWSDATTRNDWGYGLYVNGASVSNGIYLSSITLATAGTNYGFYMETTSASTNASNSVEAMYVKSTMTGPAGVGGRSRFHLYTNVALGGWANALKGYAEFGSSGCVTGLGSAICAEISMSAAMVAGNYAPFEAELVANAACGTGEHTAFLYANIAGSNSTGKTSLNTNGYLMILGGGVTDTAGGIIEAETVASCAATHKIKIHALGVDMWIPANTTKTA